MTIEEEKIQRLRFEVLLFLHYPIVRSDIPLDKNGYKITSEEFKKLSELEFMKILTEYLVNHHVKLTIR